MKYLVLLENMPGVTLCHETVEVPDGADSEAFSDAVKAAINEWPLSPGDTIRIVEEE